MRFKPLALTESPLVGYDYVAPADYDAAFARPGTARMAQSASAREKTYAAFDKLPWKFHVVFVNETAVASGALEKSAMRSRTDLPAQGTDYFGKSLYPDTYTGEINGIAGVYPEPGVIKFVINSDDGNNYVPFTPWMIAHRFGHALIGTNKSSESYDSYDLIQLDKHVDRVVQYIEAIMDSYIGMASVIHAIAPFASGREGRIGNLGEFLMECFAAWMIRGRIEFLPCPERVPTHLFARIPDLAPDKRPPMHSVDRSGRNYVDSEFQTISRAMNLFFKETMDKAVGRMFIV